MVNSQTPIYKIARGYCWLLSQLSLVVNNYNANKNSIIKQVVALGYNKKSFAYLKEA